MIENQFSEIIRVALMKALKHQERALQIIAVRPELNEAYIIKMALAESKKSAADSLELLGKWAIIARDGGRLQFETGPNMADAYAGAREDLLQAQREVKSLERQRSHQATRAEVAEADRDGWKARAERAERAVHQRLAGISDDAILFAMNGASGEMVPYSDERAARMVRQGRAVLALTEPPAEDTEAMQALGVTVGPETDGDADRNTRAASPQPAQWAEQRKAARGTEAGRMHSGGYVGTGETPEAAKPLRPGEFLIINNVGARPAETFHGLGGLNIADVQVESWDSRPRGGFSMAVPKGVRLTHKPTGLVVEIDSERSQHANRNIAWAKLAGKVAEGKVLGDLQASAWRSVP